MERSLLEKLATEIQRYQNKDFLKAAMAVCALSANADNEVNLVHRLIRNVHEDRNYANVSKLMEPDRVNHSSVSVH